MSSVTVCQHISLSLTDGHMGSPVRRAEERRKNPSLVYEGINFIGEHRSKMDECSITVSLAGSFNRTWRENIFPMDCLGNALIIYFAWKKRVQRLIYIWTHGQWMENVLDAGQVLEVLEGETRSSEVEVSRWQYDKYEMWWYLHYPSTLIRMHTPQKRQ